MKIQTLALAAALFLPTLSSAQIKPNEAVFTQTRAGQAVNATGSVMIEDLGRGLEVFTVSISAALANRDNLRIEVFTKEGAIDVGTLRMLLGRGTREIWSSIEPSKIFPLANVYRVIIWRGKVALLVADFTRP